MKKLPVDSFIRRASAYVVAIAIQQQAENNTIIDAIEVWKCIQDNWPDYTLPKYSVSICEKICTEIMHTFPCADAEFMEYENEEPYFDIVMWTEYTTGGTCGEEDY